MGDEGPHRVRGSRVSCTEDDVTRLFEIHYAWLCRVVVRMLRDRDRAHDIVMDVFVEVYVRRESIEIDTAPAYLKRAVTNRALTALTRKSVERGAVDTATRHGRLPGADLGDASHEHQVTEASFVLALIDRLPPQQKIAIVLKYYADMTEAEIADTMGVGPGTVKSYLSRARERLQRELPLMDTLS
jgi:RNA polymerase sigma factor (sigma-70 family)